ncbi:lactococcin 972 family bacteriocin [Streptomyces sp. NPDC048550]|uniref:lactococcin 972 family bacteriocin n=1 Tax=Streptomyces sp. NPDC048550 TaxID=3155739 RepID=UPI0034361F9A
MRKCRNVRTMAYGSVREVLSQQVNFPLQAGVDLRRISPFPTGGIREGISLWGVVTFKLDASANSVRPSEACVGPSSGGNWCYGWYTTQIGTGELRKYCYSNYYQLDKGHTSTVKMAGGTNRAWAAARNVSQAHITAGFAYTRSTYYSVD